ncbi:tRNA threonylcarbamoyladenosine dehydratase [Clostridium transplantifaecale]|uniref:tRNA threonylcarbamoyladenosine dehydratase n=1 Tax=Clostridium transplantifaecale TaxID=2479838 RepID=UPI000F632789|nr:tRNA threonylcarbamoyladenosine dehydratase [Clostridium transplantifaecale]
MDGNKRREFIRTELILGSAGMSSLKTAAVMVFGIGGVGSHCAEALARSGVGRLILIDNDDVSESNINRQCVAYHSTVGMKKTKVMEKIIGEICPSTQVTTFETFVLPDNMKEIFRKAGRVDYIVDAIDTVTAKLSLAEYAKEEGIPIISSMGTGNKLHPELFRIADISETSVCPLSRVMRKELKNRGITNLKVLFSTEKPVTPDEELEERLIREEIAESSSRRSVPGSIAFVPPVAGLLIAGEVVRELAGV